MRFNRHVQPVWLHVTQDSDEQEDVTQELNFFPLIVKYDALQR